MRRVIMSVYRPHTEKSENKAHEVYVTILTPTYGKVIGILSPTCD